MADQAYEEKLETITVPAGSDLSTKQYYPMVLNSSKQLALATGEGGDVVGILQDKPDAAGRAGCLAIGGVSKAIAGGTITAGSRVTIDVNSKFVAAASGDDWSFGVAMGAATINTIFSVLIQPLGQRI